MCSVKEKNSPTSSKNVNFVVESKIEMTVCDCKEKIVSLDCSKIYLGQGCKKKSDFTSFFKSISPFTKCLFPFKNFTRGLK